MDVPIGISKGFGVVGLNPSLIPTSHIENEKIKFLLTIVLIGSTLQLLGLFPNIPVGVMPSTHTKMEGLGNCKILSILPKNLVAITVSSFFSLARALVLSRLISFCIAVEIMACYVS